MATSRYAARVDENQAEIVGALRQVGAGVWCIRVPYDLLVAFRGALFLLDCKMGKENFSASQRLTLRLLEACGCTASAVHDVDEALRAIGTLPSEEKRP
jgi:hypothetical protein